MALLSAEGTGWICVVWVRVASLLLAVAVAVGSAVSSLCPRTLEVTLGFAAHFPQLSSRIYEN